MAGLQGTAGNRLELQHVFRQPAEHDNAGAFIQTGANNSCANSRAATGNDNDFVFQPQNGAC